MGTPKGEFNIFFPWGKEFPLFSGVLHVGFLLSEQFQAGKMGGNWYSPEKLMGEFMAQDS
jgi:hypothetical protein